MIAVLPKGGNIWSSPAQALCAPARPAFLIAASIIRIRLRVGGNIHVQNHIRVYLYTLLHIYLDLEIDRHLHHYFLFSFNSSS
jgi:hypothetical protein